jgi:ankyrin repeat protein
MDQFKAAKMGDLEQLRTVLTASNVDYVDQLCCTALHWAASQGHIECAKLCVDMHANVNARCITGYMPLHLATIYGHVGVVLVLLDAGAMIAPEKDGRSAPLYCAFCYNRIEIAQLLIDRGAKFSNDSDLGPTIPNWVNSFVASRSRCISAAVIIMGIHKDHRTDITGNNDINVLRMIGKHIWSTRMYDVWSQ